VLPLGYRIGGIEFDVSRSRIRVAAREHRACLSLARPTHGGWSVIRIRGRDRQQRGAESSGELDSLADRSNHQGISFRVVVSPTQNARQSIHPLVNVA
jgi:hypothetical protein